MEIFCAKKQRITEKHIATEKLVAPTMLVAVGYL
jgi:hypothetical protein